MDITIDAAKKSYTKYVVMVSLVVLLIVAVLAGKSYLGEATAFIDRETLRISTVKSGEFQVSVRGIGVLKPQKVVWLASRVAGRVETIFVKAGAKVDKDQPILKLNNPQVEQLAVSARSSLTRVIAEHRAALANLESEMLDTEAKVLRDEMAYLGDQLEVDAQTDLIAMGNSTVSKISYQRSKFQVKSAKLNWEIQKKRLLKLTEKVEAQKQAYQAQEDDLSSEVKRAEQQVENLLVRANVGGVLQNMDLALGQNIEMGGSIGKIADPGQLLAQIDIQELQIKDVELGQQVQIDTRKSRINGRVVRIDPQVIKGLVAVEVELEGQLPSEARPELSVEGVIMITNKSNVLYVQKPLYAQAYKAALVYRLSQEGNLAEVTSVAFGQSSVNDIEITSGLKTGDRIIISETDSFAENRQVFLHN